MLRTQQSTKKLSSQSRPKALDIVFSKAVVKMPICSLDPNPYPRARQKGQPAGKVKPCLIAKAECLFG